MRFRHKTTSSHRTAFESYIKARLIDLIVRSEQSSLTLACEFIFADGRRRADIISLGERLRVYEIKSDHDDLSKLREQTRDYQNCFDEVVAVLTKRHIRIGRRLLPDSVGILIFSEEGFEWNRLPIVRKALRKHALSQLITRHDLRRIIKAKESDHAVDAAALREEACSIFSLAELRALAHESVRARISGPYLTFLKHRGEITHTDDLLFLTRQPQELSITQQTESEEPFS